jgi:hypothetical protein
MPGDVGNMQRQLVAALNQPKKSTRRAPRRAGATRDTLRNDVTHAGRALVAVDAKIVA